MSAVIPLACDSSCLKHKEELSRRDRNAKLATSLELLHKPTDGELAEEFSDFLIGQVEQLFRDSFGFEEMKQTDVLFTRLCSFFQAQSDSGFVREIESILTKFIHSHAREVRGRENEKEASSTLAFIQLLPSFPCNE